MILTLIYYIIFDTMLCQIKMTSLDFIHIFVAVTFSCMLFCALLNVFQSLACSEYIGEFCFLGCGLNAKRLKYISLTFYFRTYEKVYGQDCNVKCVFSIFVYYVYRFYQYGHIPFYVP